MTKWNKENALKEAKKYSSYAVFYKEASGCFKYLKRNGLLDEAIKHMQKGHITIWTMAKLKEVASKYSSRKEFYIKYRGAYNRAQKDGLLDILFNDGKPNWSKEKTIPLLSKFTSFSEFKKTIPGAYSHAYINDYLSDIRKYFQKKGNTNETK